MAAAVHEIQKQPTIASYPQLSHTAIYDHQGSISTDRTSTSMDDSGYTPATERARKPIRAKGTYRLDDFIIQRTLGTGSFGRVHLGVYCVYLFLNN